MRQSRRSRPVWTPPPTIRASCAPGYTNVARELPALLARDRGARTRGGEDVEVRGPSLQSVLHPPHGQGAQRMIITLLRISWTNLKRDRVAQALTFLLPVLFFSIFATVFGNQGNAGTARIRIAVVDEDGSELSRRIAAGLAREKGLRVRAAVDEAGHGNSAQPRRSRNAGQERRRAGRR